MRFYSVDRRGFCCVGGTLDLLVQDPLGRAFLDFPGIVQSGEVASHLGSLFPEGLSMHGWEYLLAPHLRQPGGPTGEVFVSYEPALETILEFVRRAAFPSSPSRFQSYFAWESLEDARTFAAGRPIFELESEATFRADQAWLKLGYQGAMTSFCAHRYWSGEPTGSPRWELLLAPPVHIAALVR